MKRNFGEEKMANDGKRANGLRYPNFFNITLTSPKCCNNLVVQGFL